MSTPECDESLVSNIKSAEGCKLKAYLDTVGVWTIGYGHTPAHEGQTCTQEQADLWLSQDVAKAATLAAVLPEAKGLSGARLNALIELTFNMGPNRWKGFHKCRAAISDQDWQAAHDELLNSKWARQVGFHRSTRIADALLNG